ncbi:MAG: L-rhamnose mutarotase [Candidatus Sulfotelmatobacter sp.]
MRKRTLAVAFILAVLLAVAVHAKTENSHVRRVGMVIGIKTDQISAYEALHAATSPGVRDLLAKYHMHDFSIYIHQLDDGKYYLFGYYEYTGADYKADMEKLAAEPRNQKWLSVTGPMQAPLPGEQSWAMMKEVYHNP